MRALGNLFIIIFVIVTIYALREDLRPAARNIEHVIATIGEKFGLDIPIENQPLDFILGPEKRLVKEITESVTPGPLIQRSESPQSTLPATDISIQAIIALTNSERRLNGKLPALTENKTLNKMAGDKVTDMLVHQYFEHISPTGVSVSDQAAASGYRYIIVGENLALGEFATAEAIVTAWMNSPGHRANILNNRYTEIGIGIQRGIYEGREVWVAVQHFGLPTSACEEVDQLLKVSIETDQEKATSLKVTIDTIGDELDNTKNPTIYATLLKQYNELVIEYNTLIAKIKTNITNYNTGVRNFNLCAEGIK